MEHWPHLTKAQPFISDSVSITKSNPILVSSLSISVYLYSMYYIVILLYIYTLVH